MLQQLNKKNTKQSEETCKVKTITKECNNLHQIKSKESQ